MIQTCTGSPDALADMKAMIQANVAPAGRTHSNHDILHMLWPRLVLIEPYPVRRYAALPVRTVPRGEIAANA